MPPHADLQLWLVYPFWKFVNENFSISWEILFKLEIGSKKCNETIAYDVFSIGLSLLELNECQNRKYKLPIIM